MKKLFLTAGLVLGALLVNAQIKVYSSGAINVGATTSAPATNAKMQVVGGNSIFLSTDAVPTSAPLIFAPVSNSWSSAGQPDYSWYGDVQSGIFHPAAGVIAFSVSNAERMRLTANGLFLGSSTDPGNVKLYVTAASGKQAIGSSTSYTTDYNYHQVNVVNRGLTKAYAVLNGATETFYVYGNGTVWSAGLYTGSDKSLKENIDTLRGALSKVLKLQGFTYNYKSSFTGMALPKKELGLIAQDVEQILPEAVLANDKGIKAIAYGNLTALLIEAVKEQDKKITQLQNDLAVCCPKTGNRTINQNGSDGKNLNVNPSLNSEVIGKLWQNVPNPFNQTTNIKCFVPDASKAASLLVFDMNGTLKKTIQINGKGEVSLTLNAKELIAGMYYYSLIVDNTEVDTKKMILTEQ